MTLQRQFGFWVIALAVLILVLWFLSNILLPFIAGLVLAYFLDPSRTRSNGWGCRVWPPLFSSWRSVFSR